ncbi:MAG TPA: zinc-dependent metalloprotease [Acidimicrobiales bacterium]|nr:zinc-dependent metalloprotease [Acidimicrobiales bacterium]
MADDGPAGNPFEGLPFLGDLARLLGQQAGGAWDSARQLAVTVATEGTSESNVDPVQRMGIEQLARVADLHVADVTGLSTSVSGRPVVVVPVNRTRWVMDSLEAYRPLVERLAATLGSPPEDAGLDEDPAADMFAGMLQALQPMVLAMTAGSMVGHLGQRTLGQYDLPIPRTLDGPHADELLLVVPNIDAFADEWSLERDDVRLWVCVHELAHHAVLGVPHVRVALDDLLAQYASAFQNDPSAIEDRLGELDLGDPSSLAGLQEAIGSPDLILGAITSPEQDALRPRLEALVAVVVGVVDHVLDVVGGKLISTYPMLTEALRRRRVEAGEADRFVERLFGLELGQATYDRGTTFVQGVLERAGDDGLRRLWAEAANLPTPAEVDAPGLWLARIDL